MNQKKIAIVVGGSGDIGKVIAKDLLGAGFSVVLASRSRDKLERAASEISPDGQVLVVPTDATDHKQVVSMFDSVEKDLGPVDLVVITAGGYQGVDINTPIDQAAETFKKLGNINLLGPQIVGFVAAQRMKERNSGYIFNVSSHAAIKNLSAGLAYGPSKAGILKFSQQLVGELKEGDVRVTDIMPATVNTESMSGLIPEDKRHLAVQPSVISKVILDLYDSDPHSHVPEVLIDGQFEF